MPLTVTGPCEPLVGTVLFLGIIMSLVVREQNTLFLQELSVAERLTQRELSERSQSNRPALWGCCGMNCKEALTWFRGVIVPFLLSH